MRIGNAAGFSFGCADTIPSEKRQIRKQIPGIVHFMRFLRYDDAGYHEPDGLAAQLPDTAASIVPGNIFVFLSS